LGDSIGTEPCVEFLIPNSGVGLSLKPGEKWIEKRTIRLAVAKIQSQGLEPIGKDGYPPNRTLIVFQLNRKRVIRTGEEDGFVDVFAGRGPGQAVERLFAANDDGPVPNLSGNGSVWMRNQNQKSAGQITWRKTPTLGFLEEGRTGGFHSLLHKRKALLGGQRDFAFRQSCATSRKGLNHGKFRPKVTPLSRAGSVRRRDDQVMGSDLSPAKGVLSRLQSAPMSASRNHRACNFPLSRLHPLPENSILVFYRYPQPTKDTLQEQTRKEILSV